MKEAYQLPKRNNYKNRFQPGITGKDHYGTNPFENTGVPTNGFKGDPKDQGRGQFGIPIPGTGQTQRTPTPKICTATTKKGNPCKAAPVTGTGLCIGHTQSAAS